MGINLAMGSREPSRDKDAVVPEETSVAYRNRLLTVVSLGGMLMKPSSRTLQLLFLGNAQSQPFPAQSYVCVRSWSESEDGPPLLTPECVNPTELDTWIDDLKRDLDRIKLEAHRRYAAYDQQTLRCIMKPP